MTRFIAQSVTVLNFSRKPDQQDMIIPPECHAVFAKEPVPVCFDFDYKNVVGTARLQRKGNKLLADIELWSEMTPPEKALQLIQQLRPAVAFMILDAHEDVVTHIRITGVSVGPGLNADPRILPMGTKVKFKHAGKDMH
jgi:hypothetical protein